MVLRIVFFIFLGWVQNLNALESLMFSAQECENIKCERHKKHLEDMLNTGRALKCDGILYTSPTDWTLWMNGQRISAKSPTTLKPWIIEKVTAQEVRGVFKVGSLSYSLLLKPGQSFFAPEPVRSDSTVN